MRELHKSPEAKQSTERLLEKLLSPQPVVIGLEGGPCGGKTTAINHITQQAELERVPCIVVPEVATDFIGKLAEEGIELVDLIENDRPAYLEFQLAITLEINKRIEEARQAMEGIDGRIIVDRTTVKPYVSESEYDAIIKSAQLNGVDPLGVIDKMIYLPSLARLDGSKYDAMRSTNAVRYETCSQAGRQCLENLRAIAAHPELHIVSDANDFHDVLDRVGRLALSDDEIEGKWQPKRAFSDDRTEMAELLSQKSKQGELLNSIRITQSYHEFEGLEYRLRRSRATDGSIDDLYQFTIKHQTNEGRTELSRSITVEQYDQLQAEGLLIGSLEKVRYHFIHDWQVWSADFVPHMPEGQQWYLEAEVARHSDLKKLSTDFMALQECAVSMRELASKATS